MEREMIYFIYQRKGNLTMLERDKKKTQEFQVDDDFEIEESNAAKRLRLKGESTDGPKASEYDNYKAGKAENFWYRNRWRAGIIAILFILVGYALYSCFTHVDEDVSVLYTGVADFGGGRYEKVEEAFKDAMRDYNNDGHLKISLSAHQYYTDNQVEMRRKAGISVNELENSAEYKTYFELVATGEYVFSMLDPELHEELAKREAFIPLTDVFDAVPAGAYDEYGITIGSTEFYKSHPGIQFIPADTVLSVRVPAVINVNSDAKKKERVEIHSELLRDIVNYTPPKETKGE